MQTVIEEAANLRQLQFHILDGEDVCLIELPKV